MAWKPEPVTSSMAFVMRNNPEQKTHLCPQTPVALTLKQVGLLEQGRRLINSSLPGPADRYKAENGWREPRAAPRLLSQANHLVLPPCI